MWILFILDYCFNFGVDVYKCLGGCRFYFFCEYGVFVFICCKKGFWFDGKVCVKDSLCNDICVILNDLKRKLS